MENERFDREIMLRDWEMKCIKGSKFVNQNDMILRSNNS